ncbi:MULTISPECIES: hypothetical protein [Ligilactobacillus]|jgi:hypothetical protein|nr:MULTISPECIES: hypothetical protein [Ligilactobacillus]MCI5941691.1 hypothetical protein [Ligilactobacillus animalis]MCR1895846.1 hypothetical protein [Ligilactobacillus murinus]MDE7023586.1 hypothetical protein [Ligilactobacillus sp.]TGY52921.1 hypothetical protein E5341_04660 [Ligilactobacillus murinus]
MAKIYKINSVTFEYAYMEISGKTPGYYSTEDLYYIRDFWFGWEGTIKNDGYIEIDDVNRLICERLIKEEAEKIKRAITSDMKVIELPKGTEVPTYKNPYKKLDVY